jgi:hypothetical protein
VDSCIFYLADGPTFTTSSSDMKAAAARIHAEPFTDVIVLFEQDE